jgi:phosphoglucosamine mutase
VSRKYFGTDGIRGVANVSLTPELAYSLGRAAGRFLIGSKLSPRAVIGRDTRRSGPMLESALSAGLCSTGVDVVSLGVVPTPTVSFAARTLDYGLGVVISASHNPAPDNGIKLLGHDGKKFCDDTELAIESLIGDEDGPRPSGGAVGSFEYDRSVCDAYVAYLASTVPERLAGLRVAVDASNGAAYELAPQVLISLGAEVFLVGAEPDGMNINAEGGATKPGVIQQFTVDAGAHVGVAFDGDADRAVFSDERGRLVNGDRTMGIWCSHWQRVGSLDPPIAVGTVMSNIGFERFLSSRGIRLERAPVGDKYVSQMLDATGAKVGGEQSGHLIFPELGPTGDGLATTLQLLRVLVREQRPLSSFYDDFDPWPQLLVNVGVASRVGWDQGQKVADALRQAESRLAEQGRLVVRASGTQPMVRVMVEAKSLELRDEVANSIVSAMEAEIGGTVEGRVDLTYALGD